MTPKSFHGLFARIGERAQRAAEAEADRRADSRRDVNIDAARVRILMAPMEHRIEARNTTRAEPSPYQPAKSSICLIVHAIDR
jgi:hypothetical protein